MSNIIQDRIRIKKELEEFKEADIQEYSILVIDDEKTCERCRKFKNQKLAVKNAKIGINAPPFHDGCRCDVVAVLPTEEELDREWEEFKKSIPDGLTPDEYLERLQPTGDGKLKYVPKNNKAVPPPMPFKPIKKKSPNDFIAIAIGVFLCWLSISGSYILGFFGLICIAAGICTPYQLNYCPNCNRSKDFSAKTCPSCGKRFNTPISNIALGIIIVMVGMAILAMMKV